MGKLTESAKDILSSNVSAKQDARKVDSWAPRSDGVNKSVGDIGTEITKPGDAGPDNTKGVPRATPPGAKPPVGAQTDGVGASKPQGQPAETMGRTDLAVDPTKIGYEDLNAIANRQPSKLPAQTFSKNPGATFQNYGEGLDLSADVDALLEGEGLSEDFKTKATTIFEAAVTSRIQSIAEQIEANLTEQFDSAVEEVKNQLAEKVDTLLDYMVKEWVESNEVAIESGLRAEIVEDFMGKLHALFVESYIDVPEDKVDIVEELTARVEDLEDKLNEQLLNNVELSKTVNEHKKVEAIHAVCEGLTLTQVEKLKSLAEGVEFTTEGEFADKLKTLRESYFSSSVKPADKTALNEDVEFPDIQDKKTVGTDPLMENYVKTISKTLNK
jgi:hypothetical protein